MSQEEAVSLEMKRVEDGKDDYIFSFDGQNAHITVHKELVDLLPGTPEEKDKLAEGVGKVMVGMIKQVLEATA